MTYIQLCYNPSLRGYAYIKKSHSYLHGELSHYENVMNYDLMTSAAERATVK